MGQGEDDGPVGLGLRHDMPVPEPELAAPPTRRGLRRKPRAPSRLSYRTQRIWLTPLYRRAIKIGVPVVAALAMLGVSVGNEERRASLLAQAEAAYSAVVDRPEFMVSRIDLSPTAPVLDEAIRALLADDLPLSSWRIDLEEMRTRIEALDAVRVADLRVAADGVLSVSVTERVPAVLWRSPDGLEVLDAEGIRIGFAPDRHVRPDLPIIAGVGASAHVAEALTLIDAAAPLGERLRGLVRQGERRWDVVLERERRIKLPERGAVTALERVIALDQAQDLLARDLIVADLRNPARPTLKISTGAMETIRAIRAQN
ncbi:MAG: cell division protein FtsQ/DivIB [Rhodobacteraceae bacterium]|nr:cell division protein FtsQ/DivIB [Paracoccaceae bacterium]